MWITKSYICLSTAPHANYLGDGSSLLGIGFVAKLTSWTGTTNAFLGPLGGSQLVRLPNVVAKGIKDFKSYASAANAAVNTRLAEHANRKRHILIVSGFETFEAIFERPQLQRKTIPVVRQNLDVSRILATMRPWAFRVVEGPAIDDQVDVVWDVNVLLLELVLKELVKIGVLHGSLLNVQLVGASDEDFDALHTTSALGRTSGARPQNG